jgi:hypothetical protein
MDSRQRRLETKVKAFNAAHQFANELYPKLAAVFTPLVGCKVVKVDGSLLAKVASQLPEMPNTHNLMVYPGHSNYSLRWVVKTSEMDSEHTCLYAEAGVYVADIRDGVVTKIYDAPNLRSDYAVAEIEVKREIYKAAKRAADAAYSALSPFGEYDN